MRFYGFQASELTTESQPELSLTEDPKTTWARTHPEFFPVDINTAPRESILRVPGIGYRNVERILNIRRYHPLTTEDLRKLNVRLKQSLPYLITTDHLPTAASLIPSTPESATQLDLFAPISALTGSV